MMFLTPLMGFWMLMALSVLAALSSSTMFFLWVSLEINMISILPVLNSDRSFFSTGVCLKYFISQSLASIFFILLAAVLAGATSSYFSLLTALAILFKMGVPPFHSWLLSVLMVCPYKTMFLILFLQKFIPLHILSSVLGEWGPVIWILPAAAALIFFSLKNISCLRTCLILSAWGNSTWMLVAAIFSKAWMGFLALYGIMLYAVVTLLEFFNIQKISSLVGLGHAPKIFCLVNFFNLAGLPPLAGFFMKLFLLKVAIAAAPAISIIFLLGVSVLVLFAYVAVSYYSLSSPGSPQSPGGPRAGLTPLAVSTLSWGAFPMISTFST